MDRCVFIAAPSQVTSFKLECNRETGYTFCVALGERTTSESLAKEHDCSPGRHLSATRVCVCGWVSKKRKVCYWYAYKVARELCHTTWLEDGSDARHQAKRGWDEGKKEKRRM